MATQSFNPSATPVTEEPPFPLKEAPPAFLVAVQGWLKDLRLPKTLSNLTDVHSAKTHHPHADGLFFGYISLHGAMKTPAASGASWVGQPRPSHAVASKSAVVPTVLIFWRSTWYTTASVDTGRKAIAALSTLNTAPVGLANQLILNSATSMYWCAYTKAPT